MQLLLEPAELLERLLQLAVLERDRGVVGERLEELEVLGLERADVAQRSRTTRSVPTSVDSPSQRRDQRLAAVSPGRVVRSLDRRQVDEPALPLGDGADQDRIVERRTGRLHLEDGVAGSDLAAHDLVAVMPGQQADLGHVGAEHLPGVVEQRQRSRVSSCGLRWRIRVDS